MPETTGLGRFFVIGALAVVFGLGAASLLAAIVGDRWGGPSYARHRGVALVVGLVYLGIGLIVLFVFRDQLAA
jgi:hypothetical protein